MATSSFFFTEIQIIQLCNDIHSNPWENENKINMSYSQYNSKGKKKTKKQTNILWDTEKKLG